MNRTLLPNPLRIGESAAVRRAKVRNVTEPVIRRLTTLLFEEK
jgi:hypothetical protein